MTNYFRQIVFTENMKPLFSFKFTIFLLAALFLPFSMKTAHSKLEPYPAIILPSGAGKLNLQEGVIKVNNLAIYGYDFQGKLQKIDAKKLLDPIPNQYLYAVVDNEFGLSTKITDEVLLRGLDKKIEIKRKVPNSKDRRLAQVWLAGKLSDLRLSNSSIIVRYELRQLEINTGREVSKEIENEKHILLR